MVRRLDATTLTDFRKLLFRPIGYELLTGYTIAPRWKSEAQSRVSYQHNELKEGRRHRRRLLECLSQGLESEIEPCLNFERVDRTAHYRLEKGWTADQYYDMNVQQLSEVEALRAIRSGLTIIGVEEQDDLRIELQDSQNLRDVLEVLRVRANRFRIDGKSGDYVRRQGSKVLNRYRIWGAWERSLMMLPQAVPSSAGYADVVKIDFKGFDKDVYALVSKGKNEDVKLLLDQVPALRTTATKAWTNKVFSDWLDLTKNANRYNWFVRQLRKVREAEPSTC